MNSLTKPDSIQGFKNVTIREPTDEEFEFFRSLVLTELGLNWAGDKKYLLYARLQRRLQSLKLTTFKEYHEYLKKQNNAIELQHLFNAVTTTKTGFYREKQHFEFLREKIFPEMRELIVCKRKKLRFWSAGCSCGEEPFNLAIEAHDYFGPKLTSGGGLRILASDVNTAVLESAEKGQYTFEQVRPVPVDLRNRYFDSGSVLQKENYLIKTDIKKLIQFRHFNLMASEYPIATKFQLIFCRNVLYYLNSERREKLLNKLVSHLDNNGWLVLGITESGYRVNGMQKLSYCIYRKN
ncbi:MAG: protein-glutamate O-methyltransferase CheR [SAR324 cluster bacterium]|jgi:chemotaxis protein methyltransferase CheR|nr:protein-glutamate O-methyltransferase CheR [SAR324 cluster bacterium]|tara:strand:+ start:46 stop:927 length:882 start_codon:yes stop_codon:yes gene_type:complete